VEILSKAQRNALFDAVAVSELPQSDFAYQAFPSFTGNTTDEAWIRHAPSGSRFEIFPERDSSVFTGRSHVGDDPWVPLDYRMNFSELVERVGSWSLDLAEWIGTPDSWKSMPDPGSIPGELTPDSDNTYFAPAEQAAIAAQLKEIAESIKKAYELTAEQSAEIDRKFEEAEKASQRMGRKDWGMFFGGIALSLVLADIITPEVMGHIFVMIEHGIGYLFSGPSVGGILSKGSQ
jgi:hypothetical protein